MSRAGISVLTLVKQRRPHLYAMIEGLRRCDTLPSELIIVVMDDDACTIPTLPFPVRVTRHAAQGLPLAPARNRATAASRSAHLLFPDVDCIPMRGLPEAMIDHLAHHDGLIGAEVLYRPGNVAATPFDEAALAAQGEHIVRDRVPATALFPCRSLACSGPSRSACAAPNLPALAVSMTASSVMVQKTTIWRSVPRGKVYQTCWPVAPVCFTNTTQPVIRRYSISAIFCAMRYYFIRSGASSRWTDGWISLKHLG